MEIENSKPNERKEDKCVDYAGMNILHLAVRFHPKAVRPLLIVLQDDYLTKGLINQQTSFTGETPLHLAARIGDIDVVQQLLKHLAGMARPLTRRGFLFYFQFYRGKKDLQRKKKPHSSLASRFLVEK